MRLCFVVKMCARDSTMKQYSNSIAFGYSSPYLHAAIGELWMYNINDRISALSINLLFKPCTEA